MFYADTRIIIIVQPEESLQGIKKRKTKKNSNPIDHEEIMKTYEEEKKREFRMMEFHFWG